jgi:hypothetical protein
LAFIAELVSREVPVGAVAGTGGLHIDALLAGLPAAGEHDGAIYRCALLAVDGLGIGESQGLDVLAGEPHGAARAIQREREGSIAADVRDLAAGAVLDAGLSGRPMLGDERDVIALA